MRPKLVADSAWMAARGKVEPPIRPALAVSMDVSGQRASAVIAWQQSDGSVAISVVADVHGNPIDVDLLGPELRQKAVRLGATKGIAFDSWTDSDLARHLKDSKAIIGREFANASENFVRVVESGRLRWQDADEVTSDLAWTSRKARENGAWDAVKARDDRPITAALAAVRAVWLASGPKPSVPRVL